MSKSPKPVLRRHGSRGNKIATDSKCPSQLPSAYEKKLPECPQRVPSSNAVSDVLSRTTSFLRKLNCFAPRTVLPLHARTRTFLQGAPHVCSTVLQELNLDRTWQLILLLPSICLDVERELLYSIRKACRRYLPSSTKLRFFIFLALPLPFVISYRSLDYMSRQNEALWQELAAAYDVDSNARYSMSELKGIFKWEYHGKCQQDSMCIPHEHASKWVEEVDIQQDGVDREELLDMFQQMPKPFMPPYFVDRMQQVESTTQYLKLTQKFFVGLSILLAGLSIRWLYNEVKLRQLLSWSMARDARRRQGYEKKANESQREIEQTRHRLLHAHRELARLSNEHRRVEQEQRNIEAELEDRERLLRALVDPLDEVDRPQHSRQIWFLYASPLMILSKEGVPIPVEPLRIEEEYKLVRGALASDGVQHLQVDLATPQRLMKLVLSDSPGACLHLSCHGGEDCLYLESPIGCMSPLAVTTARNLLSQPHCSTAAEVVVLLCCSSENFGNVLLEAGVHHVVCTRGKLSDRAAREFSQVFWSRMSNPETSVEEAFHHAIILLRAHGSEFARDAGLLVLLALQSTKLKHLQSARNLPRRSGSMSSLSAPSHGLELPHLSTSTEDFIGRDFFLCNLLNCFVDGRKPRRIVCVHGVPGIGKTAFASFLAHFAHMRGRLFSHSVVYDSLWSSRSESMLWLWLEAAWRMNAQEAWEWEAAGLHAGSPVDDLLQSLCTELQRDQPQRRLLIVDDADRKEESILEAALGELLTSTSLCVIIISRRAWRNDISGFKVVNMQLGKLDSLSSAKLFLRRSRRPLRRADFEIFDAGDDLISSLGSTTAGDWQSHVHALLQHPLHKILDGHPARIRKAAEQVTDDLPSLTDLYNRSVAVSLESSAAADQDEC